MTNLMNKFFSTIVLASFAFGPPVYGDMEPISDHTNRIKLAAQYLQPDLSDADAEIVAEEIVSASTEMEVRWEVILSILFQESSLRLDPQGCMKIKRRCSDYGIGQVNYRVWGKTFGWDRIRLLTDLRYSLQAAFQVLRHYKKTYHRQEFNWFSRYHSGTPSFRARYMGHLNRQYSRINTFLDGFEKGRGYATSSLEETPVVPH